MIPWTCKNRDAQTVWGRLQSHCWSLNPHPTRMSQRFPLPHYPVFQMVSCHVYNEDTWLYFTVKVALHVQQFETRPYQMFSFFLIISFHTYSCATICSVGEKNPPIRVDWCAKTCLKANEFFCASKSCEPVTHLVSVSLFSAHGLLGFFSVSFLF